MQLSVRLNAEINDIVSNADNLLAAIKECTLGLFLNMSQIKSRGAFNRPWFDSKCKLLKRNMRKAYRSYKSSRCDDENLTKYLNLKKNIKNK